MTNDISQSKWDQILEELKRQNIARREEYLLMLKRREFFMGFLGTILAILLSFGIGMNFSYILGTLIIFLDLFIAVCYYHKYTRIELGPDIEELVNKLEKGENIELKATIAHYINKSNKGHVKITKRMERVSKIQLYLLLFGLFFVLLGVLEIYRLAIPAFF
jgi:hypothetical protein